MKKIIPFPQANSIDLIYALFFDIGADGISKAYVAKKYDIDERQGAYYLDTLLYLGLADKQNVKYFLSNSGMHLRLSGADTIKRDFCDVILKHAFLGRVYSETKSVMDRAEKKKRIAYEIFSNYDLNENTSSRRASSILAWFEWIDSVKGENGDKR